MGFYLRKSFGFGPIRLNLSKSGLGASVGVKGARVGITSRGRAYIHAGRGGVYVREYLGGPAARPGSMHTRSEPITLYEDTGVTYAAAPDPRNVATTSRRTAGPESGAGLGFGLIAIGLLCIIAALLVGGGSSIGLVIVGLAALGLGAVPIVRSRREAAAKESLHRLLQAAVATGRPLPEPDLEAVRAALRDSRLSDRSRAAVFERIYHSVVRMIVEDGTVTADEAALLGQLEADFGLDAEFCTTARADAFRGLYLAAVADHELTRDEERELDHIRNALRVPADEIADELVVLERLAEMRRIREGVLPIVEPGTPLRRGETCHYEGPGRLLKEKNLRTFRQDGVPYRVRGLTVDKEGTLLITDRRVLLVHTGTTTIPLDRILDVEVEADRNLFRITKDGTTSPVLLTTSDAMLAGAIIAELRGL